MLFLLLGSLALLAVLAAHIATRIHRFDRPLGAAGLHRSFGHPSDNGEWIVHFDGDLAPHLPAGARLDAHTLTLSAELTIADGRLDLPLARYHTLEATAGRELADALVHSPPERRAAIERHLAHPGFVVTTCPASAEAARLAPALLDDDDPLVAISAAAVVGEPPAIVAVLTRPPTDRVVPDAVTRHLAALFDRLRGALKPTAAAQIAPRITDPRLRACWLEALLRGGDEDAPRRAAATDPDPQVRAALLTRLAHHVGRHGALDPPLQALLIAALTGHAIPARAAARALAAHGDADALRPLGRWRARLGVPPPAHLRDLAGLVDAGIARIGAGLDPTLGGQLTLVDPATDGRLTLTDAAGRLTVASDDDPAR